MVRYKKRYFVIQLDRHSDVAEQLQQQQRAVDDGNGDDDVRHSEKKKKKLSVRMKPAKKRSLCDPRPLDFNDGHLSNAIKDVVTKIHGDFGRASVTIGSHLITLL